jgi:hypothetical protein
MTMRSAGLALFCAATLPAVAAAQATNFPGGSLTGYTGTGIYGTSTAGTNITPQSGSHFGYVTTESESEGDPEFEPLWGGPAPFSSSLLRASSPRGRARRSASGAAS